MTNRVLSAFNFTLTKKGKDNDIDLDKTYEYNIMNTYFNIEDHDPM